MSDTVTNDPTADQGLYRINPPSERGGLEVPSTGLERGASLRDRAQGDQTPGSTKLQRELEQSQREADTEHQDFVNRRNAAYAELHRREAQRPRIPTQQNLGPPPDAREYQKHTMAWAGAMAMVGSLFAKGGRMSGQQAMDAFSGAMKGWHEGNLEAYTNSVDKWQNSNTQTLENNRQLMEKYQLVLDNHRLNIDQQMAEIQRISVEERDNMTFRLAREKNITGIAQLQDYRMGTNERLKRATEQLQLNVDKGKLEGERIAQQYGPLVGPNFENLDKFVHKDGTPWTNQEKQNVRYNIQKYGPPDVASITAGGYKSNMARYVGPRSQELKATGMSESEAVGKATDEWNERSTRAKLIAAADPKALTKALTSLTEADANLESFSNNTQKNLDRLVQLAGKVDTKTGIPIFNKWILQGRQAKGDVDVSNMMLQMQILQADAARIITNPTLKGVLSDSARNEMHDAFPTYSTLPQIKGLAEQLRMDFKNRREANEEEINLIRGKLSALGSLGGGTSAAAPAMTSQATAKPQMPAGAREVTLDGKVYWETKDGQFIDPETPGSL